ncbi:MAG: glycosyltransferase family 4 protein [Bifidobacteriaceae bacterium]|nr:glycosyltransferase family 4 protein [Bifidobacteriaceae bacterium]
MKQTLNIIRGLDRAAFEPILVTLFPEMDQSTLIAAYVDEVRERHCLGLSRAQAAVQGKRHLNELLEKIEPDIIHAVGMPIYSYSLGYRSAGHVTTLRAYLPVDYRDRFGKLAGGLLAKRDVELIRRQQAAEEGVVTCSMALAELYEREHGLCLKVIRNGVDTNSYAPRAEGERQSARRSLGLPREGLIVTYAGPMIDRKDQQSAIEGFLASRISGSHLLLLGGGENYDKLRKRYSRHSAIIMPGDVEQVREYLAASDLYVSTSKSEGLPNAVLEAMSVGLPVVLSDIPQHLEVLRLAASVGTSYALGRTSDLAEKLLGMANRDLAGMGRSASCAVRKSLSSVENSRQYQRLYDRLNMQRGA